MNVLYVVWRLSTDMFLRPATPYRMLDSTYPCICSLQLLHIQYQLSTARFGFPKLARQVEILCRQQTLC